jgi:hypothetical protein
MSIIWNNWWCCSVFCAFVYNMSHLQIKDDMHDIRINEIFYLNYWYDFCFSDEDYFQDFKVSELYSRVKIFFRRNWEEKITSKFKTFQSQRSKILLIYSILIFNFFAIFARVFLFSKFDSSFHRNELLYQAVFYFYWNT